MRIDLDQRGNQFVRQTLEDGYRMCQEILKHVEIDAGSAFTLLSQTTSKAELYLLDDTIPGGYLDAHGRQNYELFCEFLADYLRNTRSAILFLEDPVGRVGDPWLRRTPPEYKYKSIDKELFVYCLDADETSIDTAVNFATDATHTTGILSRYANAASWEPMTPMDTEELQTIVTSLEYIFVLAYDGLGYVIWERGK